MLRNLSRRISPLPLLLLAAACWTSAAAAQNVDLGLLGRQELGPPPPCSFSLWQSDRDPAKDKYAYAFYEAMDANHARRPAIIELADKRVAFQRLAAGGKTAGMRVYEVQHYRSTDGVYDAVMELTLSSSAAGRITVPSGVLTITTTGKLPFRLAVKGLAECAAAAPAAATAAATALRSARVPAAKLPPALIAQAAKQMNCDGEFMKRKDATAYQYSDTQAVWMIPCEDGPERLHLFARVSVDQPAKFELMAFEAPPGAKREWSAGVLNTPVWNIAQRTVTNMPGDDQSFACGSFETHQLVDGRFKLIELRSKNTNCAGGRPMKPSAFPVTYQAK